MISSTDSVIVLASERFSNELLKDFRANRARTLTKAGAKRERDLPRVHESPNSRSRLAPNSHALSATLARSHRIWTCSNFCWESPRVFSRLARVCLVTRWTLVNSRSCLARRTIVNKSWRKLSFNSHRLNSRQLSVSFGPALRANLDGTVFPNDCSMRLAHVTYTTQIVSCKSEVHHLHDSCTQHEKCRRILKHVLKPYDSRSHNQNIRMTSCIRSLPDACSAPYKSRIRQS